MAKKSQRRPSRNERDQAGCISGFISMFDFRQGRSTRKLLADKRRVNKQAIDAAKQSNIQTIVSVPAENCEKVEDAEESQLHVSDVAKTSVKKLMEEEMIHEQGSTDQITDSNMSLEQNDSKHGKYSKKNRRRNKARNNKSADMDVTELENAGHDQTRWNAIDLLNLVEELAQVNQIKIRKHKKESNGGHDTPCTKDIKIVEDKLVATVKLLLEQQTNKSKHFGEEEEENSEFMDALEMLSLNKSSFLKLLQDPNSVLVKHIENLEDAQLSKDQVPSSVSGEPANSKSDESRKHRNFFSRRRSKSLGSYPLDMVKDNVQSPNRIVILKPGPAESDSTGQTDIAANRVSSRLSDVDSKVLITRHSSHFSLTEMKRKLWHAMGKETRGTSPDKLVSKVKHQSASHIERANLGWSSPNRNHFYTERFTLSSPSFKREEQVDKLKEKVLVNANDTSQYPRIAGSNIYVEARKHLSAMLNNGDENVESFNGQLPKPLGRILSLPSYSTSPCSSPRKHGEELSMRSSPRGMIKDNEGGTLRENDENCVSPSRDSLESSDKTNVEVSGTDDQQCSLEIQSSVEDNTIYEVESSTSIASEIEETIDVKLQEEEMIVSISCGSSNHSTPDDDLNEDTIDIDNEESDLVHSEESSQCFKLDASKEDQELSSPTMSPSHSPLNKDIQDSDYALEKIERPSPISILEPLYTDDEISPQCIMPQPVHKDIEPRHIHFEEQSSPVDQVICTRISLEDEESAFEYVEAVLLGSGLNWDEFSQRWLSNHEILDTSLFDEVELFSSQSRHDQQLLFDCANEALKEICRSYFGCFTGISCLKQTNQQVPRGMDLIIEVWNRIETCLAFNPQPLSLDQLVRRDLTGSNKWMDLRPDIEVVGTEMEDAIFDELMVETVLSYEDDTLEFEHSENAIEVTDL